MIQKLSLKKDMIVSSEKGDFVNIIEKSIKSPIAILKYCYLSKPFFYPGSAVPRYSITLLFDKKSQDHQVFLNKIEKLATENNVDSLGYLTSEGLISLKFQTKDKVKLYAKYPHEKKEKQIELEHDLPEGFKAAVEFELNTYFNKKTQKNGFNFSPKKVIFHIDEDLQNSVEVENGDSKDSRSRPRPKKHGVRDNKLRPGKKRNMGDKLRDDKNTKKV